MALKTNLHGIFETDSSLEEAGTWVPVNDYLGLDIKVRRINSVAVDKWRMKYVAERFGRGKGAHKEDAEIGAEEALQMHKDLLAEVILVDWRGIKDEDGSEIPYSIETARELIEMRDFRQFISEAASERDTFRPKDDEAGAKNS